MKNNKTNDIKLPPHPTTTDILIETEGLSRGRAFTIGGAIDNATKNPNQEIISNAINFYDLNEDIMQSLPVREKRQLITDHLISSGVM